MAGKNEKKKKGEYVGIAIEPTLESMSKTFNESEAGHTQQDVPHDGLM